MDLVKLSDKVFDKALIEGDEADELLGPARVSGAFHDLWLQQEVFVAADFEFQVLAHQVGQECSDFYLHLLAHCSDVLVVDQQMLLHRLRSQLLALLLDRLLLSHALLQLLVKQSSELNEQVDGGHLDLRLLEVMLVPQLGYGVSFFAGVVDELLHEVAHHIDDADGGNLLAGKRHYVKTNLVLVEAALLDVDLLLLSNS